MNRHQEFIRQYRSVQERESGEVKKRCEGLIALAAPILRQRLVHQKQAASRFNIFNILAVADLEEHHSLFLAYLLDPLAAHDQGDKFLREFLNTVLSFDVDPGITLDALVVTEEPAEPFGRLDITIRLSDGRIVVIENKVNAQEGDKQLERYQTWLDMQPRPQVGEHTLIFLTPTGRSPRTALCEGVRCLSYRDVGLWLSSFLGSAPLRLQVVLTQYVEICYAFGNVYGRSYMGDDLDALLRDPNNLEIALEISEAVKSVQREVYKEFWGNVKTLLQSYLQDSANDAKWEIYMDDDIFGTFSKIGLICKKKREGNLLFSFLFECLAGKPTYYGIMRGKPIPNESLVEEDKLLSDNLVKEKNLSKSVWWAGYQNLAKLNLNHFSGLNKQNTLCLHRDNVKEDHQLAKITADVLWNLFLKYHLQVERLNERYPY